MMRQQMYRVLSVVLTVLLSLATTLAFALDVERMSTDELRGKLGQEGLVVVDVRTNRDWKSSESKIKGAERPEADIVKWAAQYDKETTLVLYCA